METVTLFHVGDSYEAYFEERRNDYPDHGSASFKMTAANIPAVHGYQILPWRNVETGCWMQDMKYACPNFGGHPAATSSKFYETVKKAG